VVGAEEDDFSHLAVVVLHVEDDLGLDDARVVEMEALDLSCARSHGSPR
jgi:hypothetical protein